MTAGCRRCARLQTSLVRPSASAAGTHVADPGHVERGRAAARARRQIAVHGVRANFLLVRVGDAAAIRMRLLREHRVCVRDCASFGLPEHVRIGVRRMEDCRRLAGALQEVLGKTDG